ncbi:TatD family hydrolase [Desulfuromonas sp.]|uniref:TatD family hydrolase n=1 Tax=Desulfuromonas sp. TaxID=892 RepID=UPI0025C38F9D|nr:TatD family hydrolase [Desulfuromonas sp.]
MQGRAELFDTHVHLDALPSGHSLAAETDLARRAGVGRFVVPGVRREGWPELVRTVQAVEGALAAPGLHPLAALQWGPDSARELAGLLAGPRVAALGEIGLDGLLRQVPRAAQEEAFRGQLRLALEAGRPVLIHCRRAVGRLLEILREEGAGRVGGIFHAFSGSEETAREAVKLGFAIGFGGALTYPEARRLPEVLRRVPAEAIVLETDAPDLAPHPVRGGANRPCYLPFVARRVAAIRGWSPEETARITSRNARRVLKLEGR